MLAVVHNTAGATRLLLSMLGRRRAAASVIVFLGFLAALSEGIGIGLFIPFLQTLEPQAATEGGGNLLGRVLGGLFAGVEPEYQLSIIALAIFAAIVLKGLLGFAHNAFSASMIERIGHDLRIRLFDEVLQRDIRGLEKLGAGRLLNVLATESWRTTDALALLLQVFVAMGTLGVYIAMLVLISWKLTAVVAVVLVLLVLAIRFLTRNVGTFGRDITRANADMSSRMVDGVNGIEIVRSYGNEEFERGRFSAISERLARVTTRVAVLTGAVYPVYEVLAAAVVVAVLLTSPHAATSLAPLIVFVFVLFRLAPVIKRLENDRVELAAASAAVQEVASIIGEQDARSLRSGTEEISEVSEAISLEHVSYRYDPSAEFALKDISASIPATGLTAIVGPSGAGKSTLVRLLLRFFNPSEGRILVDSKPLSSLRLEDWRARLAVVPQDVFLFNATVRENIAYGDLEADEQTIVAAAKAAGADDFISNLPQGYDTRLGESGVQLSGGEGQRICLARALIREPDVLLLDEATNALDGISESVIQEVMERLKSRCAVVVIAHRMATIERADQILVLDDGQLVEQGTLDALLAQSGLFARLYELQQYEQEREGRIDFF
jgi:ABC-type multidrug transport system fused ATPase/permease subunit